MAGTREQMKVGPIVDVLFRRQIGNSGGVDSFGELAAIATAIPTNRVK